MKDPAGVDKIHEIHSPDKQKYTKKNLKGTVLVFAEKLTSLSLFYFMISKCNLMREKLAL